MTWIYKPALNRATTEAQLTVRDYMLQRTSTRGNYASRGDCVECRTKCEAKLQRTATNLAPANEVQPIVHEVLRSPGPWPAVGCGDTRISGAEVCA